MGRIKTKMIKRLTHQVVSLHKEEFKQEFGDNKKLVNKFMTTPSKKIRNAIAGYVTRLMKVKEDL